jgi:molybdopterin/thiamine biosynthesis adenylyltransferase
MNAPLAIPPDASRLRAARVAVCGVGTLGGHVAEHLARVGVGRMTLIDHDRVEAHNLSAQPYGLDDLGAPKADALAHHLYRSVEADAEPQIVRLGAANADRLLAGHDLVLDLFDNAASRRVLFGWGARTGTPTLHAGLADGFGEVIWNEAYRVPADAGMDACALALTRTLGRLTATVAAETALRFLTDGRREAYTVTLADLQIRPFI